MAAQTELECVSCGTAFDPDETGGFCPDCDTPHPDYDRSGPGSEPEGDPGEATADAEADAAAGEADESAEPAEPDTAAGDGDESTEAEVDTEAEPETGAAEAEAEPEPDEAPEPEDETDEAGADVVECDSCGHEADPEFAFCPNCGDELETDEEPSGLETCPDCSEDVDDAMSFCPNCGFDLEAAREEPDDEAEAPQEVTLVVNGESYTFGDGDTFGRQDEDWLADLVEASGGRDEVAYVSGEHLTFAVEDDGVYVSDTSANGTDLNGEPLDGGTEKLSDGDELELAGRAVVEVEL